MHGGDGDPATNSEATPLTDMEASTPPPLRWMSGALRFGERVVFTVVGVLLFGAALTLSIHALAVLYALVVGPAGSTIRLTASFLDLVLLILMIAELGYTVSLSLRGAILIPEPFLIVGLIAVIRRIIVITVQEVEGQRNAPGMYLIPQTTLELAILTLVVIAFVFAIYLLRKRAST